MSWDNFNLNSAGQFENSAETLQLNVLLTFRLYHVVLFLSNNLLIPFLILEYEYFFKEARYINNLCPKNLLELFKPIVRNLFLKSVKLVHLHAVSNVTTKYYSCCRLHWSRKRLGICSSGNKDLKERNQGAAVGSEWSYKFRTVIPGTGAAVPYNGYRPVSSRQASTGNSGLGFTVEFEILFFPICLSSIMKLKYFSSIYSSTSNL